MLTVFWAVVGQVICFRYAESVEGFIILEWSLYAIVGTHWSAHLAWRAKREAQKKTESGGN